MLFYPSKTEKANIPPIKCMKGFKQVFPMKHT